MDGISIGRMFSCVVLVVDGESSQYPWES